MDSKKSNSKLIKSDNEQKVEQAFIFNYFSLKAINTVAVVLVVITLAITGLTWNATKYKNLSKINAESPSAVTDFSKYYPNTAMYKNSYLNGSNYIGGSASWAVLWFGDMKRDGSYKMYNSDPATTMSRCHWDQFKWQRDALLYIETSSTCGSTTDTLYSPGLTYLPRRWNGGYWQKTGDSTASYYESGQLKCSGTNHWLTEIFADPVELSPGLKATHVRSTQTTTWSAGEGSLVTGCKPGETSHYQENLYFVTDLPIYGTQQVTLGLKRSVGGSLDFYATRGWDWDIWFNNWKPLP
jgi:hypothetical protein